MPYVVQRAITYKGRKLMPGDLLGDDHPKRSLLTTKKVAWQKSRPDEQRPDAPRVVDRAVSRDPALAPPQAAPVQRVIEVPTVAQVIAAGYSPEAAERIVKQQQDLLYLVDGGMSPDEAMVYMAELERGSAQAPATPEPPAAEPAVAAAAVPPEVTTSEPVAPIYVEPEPTPAVEPPPVLEVAVTPETSASAPVETVLPVEPPSPVEHSAPGEPVADIAPAAPVADAAPAPEAPSSKKGKHSRKQRKG